MTLNTHFLIIGGGIAGLSFALKAASAWPDKHILVIAKKEFKKSNTHYAQGGIAGVLPSSDDLLEKHIEDTMIAGDFKNDPRVVEMVINKGAKAIYDLVDWGVSFDTDDQGSFSLGLEGGHSEKRILHHKDITGKEIQHKMLLKASSMANITMLENHFALQLNTLNQKGKVQCTGAYVYDRANEKVLKINSEWTILATGGAGQVFETTTNPDVATGDGVVLAHRAGAEVRNADLIQFHPTALVEDHNSTAFLISEAVRGAGGILRNQNGKAYLKDYDPRAELAPRDIVARANLMEMQKEECNCVYLDVSPIAPEIMSTKFPNIKSKCESIGLDLTRDMIPVAPAAHYMCGGITVDLNGKTSVEGLFACGECSNTGLHGSNRLASNSLLEAVVYANQLFDYCQEHPTRYANQMPYEDDYPREVTGQGANDQAIEGLRQELQHNMSMYLGVEKSNKGMLKAQENIRILRSEFESLLEPKQLSISELELENLFDMAQIIIESAMSRTKNTGVYYNRDLVK